MKINKTDLKKVYDGLTRSIRIRAGGQSLVETALILPILLLMLLGVFEVGWALRGFLVLTNVNREADRFAARGVYLNFSNKEDPTKVGYEKIYSHSIDSLSKQLNPNFSTYSNAHDPYATAMLVTYYTVAPISTFGCPGDTHCTNFVCDRFADPTRGNYVAGETLNNIEYPRLIPPLGFGSHPDLPSYYNQILAITRTTAITSYYYHNGGPFFSRINPLTEVIGLRSANNALNCQRLKKNLPPIDDNIIIVEHFYNQPQITGLPFITAFVSNPVPFYSHTAMRLTTNVRQQQANQTDTCQLWPIAIPASKVAQMTQGAVVTISIDTNNAIVPGNFNYLNWKANGPWSDTILVNELRDHPTLDFTAGTWKEAMDPSTGMPDPDDQSPNIRDWVQSKSGASYSSFYNSSLLTTALNELMTNKDDLLMPVWDDTTCGAGVCPGAGGSGGSDAFRIYTFVVMKIKQVNYGGSPKQIIFQFSSFSPESCPGDDRGG